MSVTSALPLSQQLDAAVSVLEAGWRCDSPPDLSQLVGQYPEQSRGKLVVELVHIDLEYRLKRGETIRVEDYLNRLPELRGNPDAIESLFQAEFLFRRRMIREQLRALASTRPDDSPARESRLAPLPELPGYEI